jgi:beta-lactamase class A
MSRSLRIATLLVALSLILTACASPEAQATAPIPTAAPTAAPTVAPTVEPTAAPTPTAVPTLAQDVRVAGVDVGGLAEDTARAKLEDALAPLLRPLDLDALGATHTLQPSEIGFELPIDAMVAEARAAPAGGRVELQARYDEARLRAILGGLTMQPEQQAAGISVIEDTKVISRSFALTGGQMAVDVDAAVRQIDERLRSLGGARRLTLPLVPVGSARPTPKQLQEQIAAMAKGFKGVIGVYVYDIAGGKQIAGLNERTAFTAASTIKVAIMLNAYIHLPKLSAKQEAALSKMIVNSDNLRANDVLAAAAGGTSTDSAFDGAEQMSAMLADIGLKNTFLFVPFESADFIKLYKVKFKTGPKQAGEPPFTGASNTLRTTPFEMAQIYIDLQQCSQGAGILLEKYGKNLTADRCKEMIAWLKKNGDAKRMMSGLPKGADAAHKSGWIPPTIQADAGIVSSPGGDFVLAVYVYQPKEQYSDKVTEGLVGSFARLVYSYYNPILASKP